jgi:SAM-dependent methyltransferase
MHLPALRFAQKTLLDPRSPACVWKHPLQASRVVRGALTNLTLPLTERLRRARDRECPVCGWSGRSFRTFLSADEVIPACICPGCGSFDRHRLLVLGIRDELRRREGRSPRYVVGLSLSRAMRRLLEVEASARCFSSDIEIEGGRFAPDYLADLRHAPIADASLDWVISSHVLEHIPELDRCIDEILRILKPGGACWIQVPLEPGLERSRPIEIDPHRAHAHAWQFAPDFASLVTRPEWSIEEVVAEQRVAEEERLRYGIDPRERFWLARKSEPARGGEPARTPGD